MPARGSFLANLLLGGLQEGQRRREAQTTVLPHLLNLLATQQYHAATLGLRSQEDVTKRESAEATIESKRLADRDRAAATLARERLFGGALHPVTEQDIDEYLAKQNRPPSSTPTTPTTPGLPSQEQVGHVVSDVSERIRQRLLRFRP